DAAEGEARRGDGEGKRAACAEPASHQRGERHQAAGAMAEPEHDVEGVELPQLAQRAYGSERQRADGGAGGDDEARIDSLDEPARYDPADTAGDEERGRRATGKADGETALGDESGEQDGQIVE